MSMQQNVLSQEKGKMHAPAHLRFIVLGMSIMFVSASLLGPSNASAATGHQSTDVVFTTPTSDLYVKHTITVEELVAHTNKHRVDVGLPELMLNQKLVASSELKASDMATRGYFAHYTPEGKNPWFWFALVGYDYHAAGENLAVDFTDSPSIDDAWMKSPSHRKNMLSTEYTEIGISLSAGYFKGHPAIFVVEHFGSPRRSLFQF